MLSHLIKSLKTEHDLCTCTLDFGIVVDSIIMAASAFSSFSPSAGQIEEQVVKYFCRWSPPVFGGENFNAVASNVHRQMGFYYMHPRRDSIKALGPFIPLYWVAFLFKMCVDFSAKKAESLSDHTYHYHFFRFSMCKEVSHSYANVLGRRLASNRTSMPIITTSKLLTCFRSDKI